MNNTKRTSIVGSDSIFTIHPHKKRGQWCFSHDATGLIDEAFVGFSDTTLDRFCEKYGWNAVTGLVAVFSPDPFPGYNLHLKRTRSDFAGNWYQPIAEVENLPAEMWLCPAAQLYLPDKCPNIYVRLTAQ